MRTDHRAGRASSADQREFSLEDGYRDATGVVHREGALSAVTAGDEMVALRDFRVFLRADSFMKLMLVRSISRLGSIAKIDLGIIEKLSTRDLAALERLYRDLNGYGELA